MLRVALASAVLLLSGCLASAPAAPVQDVPAPDDGMVVTATRVVPLVHEVDASGVIRPHQCVDASGEGSQGCSNWIGMGWPETMWDFGDPLALFWRVDLDGEWSSGGLDDTVRLVLSVTKPCGIACVKLREVKVVEGSSGGFDALDVYLEPGETGLRLQMMPSLTTPTPADEIHYHLQGGVAGYRAAGDPIVIG